MKLAKVRYTDDGIWFVNEPYSLINRPPAGTIVQYERDSRNLYSVYFPGVQGYAPMSRLVFDRYFEDLDNESDCHGRYNVYFPGVQRYTSISGWVFGRYFEDLDNETS